MAPGARVVRGRRGLRLWHLAALVGVVAGLMAVYRATAPLGPTFQVGAAALIFLWVGGTGLVAVLGDIIASLVGGRVEAWLIRRGARPGTAGLVGLLGYVAAFGAWMMAGGRPIVGLSSILIEFVHGAIGR